MPLRQFLYDALRYESQRSEIAQRHKKAKDLTGLEYLSGFSAQDRLTPILSIVVYWGTEPWTAPLSLHELLDIRGELMEYKDKINDYRISLLDVGRMETVQAMSVLGNAETLKDYIHPDYNFSESQ